MIGGLVLALSFFLFLTKKSLVDKNGKYQNRRSVTGGEIARYILDTSGFNQTIVDSKKPGQESQDGIKHLSLDRSVYQGKSLSDIAVAARSAVFQVRVSGASLPYDFKKRIWQFTHLLVLTGWLALILGFFPGWSVFQTWGLWIFIFVFFLASFDLPAEWEASDQAFFLLKNSGHFEVDELHRLKNIFRGLRWVRLAQIFGAPYQLLSKGKIDGH